MFFRFCFIFLFFPFFFCLTIFLLGSWPAELYAQYFFRDTISVIVNSQPLKNPWAGGHNYIQISATDLNFDGIKDLFVFDRSGDKITTYINGGTPNTVDYRHAPLYESLFPHIEDWSLLADYNCDGKEDIFTYGITMGGIRVWKNTSVGGTLQFTLTVPFIQSDYGTSVTNLYVSRTDVPAIADIDNDGDLDVLTFDFTGSYLEYHINKSKELGYGCDSLIFVKDPLCWGNFKEDFTGCRVDLNTFCKVMNPDSVKKFLQLDIALSSPSGEGLYQKNPSEESADLLRSGKAHTGSCSLCFDGDGDGDKDVIIGDLACCQFTYLRNGGDTAIASIDFKDTTFPSYNIPVNFASFPCGYFLDVNNDSKRDLIVCPNVENISVNTESIWYYENIGADSAPVFQRIKRDFLQDEMIDAGEGANAVFFDYDNDGLTDLLISNYTYYSDTSCSTDRLGNVFAYKNTGTAPAPVFQLASTDYANLDSQIPNTFAKHLTFGDLDNDLDFDMMMGDYNGYIHYFENTALPNMPANFVLSQQNYLDFSNTPIDVGSFATPQLIDIDRDSDLDLVIGEYAGNLNYYQNIGSPSSPLFKPISSSFGGVDVLKSCCTGYSVPFFFDSAGTYRLIVASEGIRTQQGGTGWLWYFSNIDANLGGNFNLVDSMYMNIWEGERMTINGKDINADGLMDLVIGNYAGGVTIYRGDSIGVSVAEINTNVFDFTILPNPASGEFSIVIKNFNPSNKTELNIYNLLGERIESTNIFSASIKPQTSNFSAGIYLCELRTRQFSVVKKIVIINN